MKKLLLLFSIFTIVLSCSSDETSTPVTPPPAPIVKYTITLSAGEGGTVSTTGGEYEAGQTVSVTATPQGEYLFKDWSDGNTDATRTITVSSNSTLTANFERRKYPLTINIEGVGNVIEEIVNTGRTTDYDSGTTVKLSAETNEIWEFFKWEGAVESSETEIQLLIDEAKEITAIFLERDELKINVIGEGDILLNGEIVDNESVFYDSNADNALTAIPKDGYVFDRWSDKRWPPNATKNNELSLYKNIYKNSSTKWNYEVTAIFVKRETVWSKSIEKSGELRSARLVSSSNYESNILLGVNTDARYEPNGIIQCAQYDNGNRIWFPVLNIDNGEIINDNCFKLFSERTYLVEINSIDNSKRINATVVRTEGDPDKVDIVNLDENINLLGYPYPIKFPGIKYPNLPKFFPFQTTSGGSRLFNWDDRDNFYKDIPIKAVFNVFRTNNSLSAIVSTDSYGDGYTNNDRGYTRFWKINFEISDYGWIRNSSTNGVMKNDWLDNNYDISNLKYGNSSTYKNEDGMTILLSNDGNMSKKQVNVNNSIEIFDFEANLFAEDDGYSSKILKSNYVFFGDTAYSLSIVKKSFGNYNSDDEASYNLIFRKLINGKVVYEETLELIVDLKRYETETNYRLKNTAFNIIKTNDENQIVIIYQFGGIKIMKIEFKE